VIGRAQNMLASLNDDATRAERRATRTLRKVKRAARTNGSR
jgi:hypothetical protein